MVIWAAAALVGIWVAAMAGYHLARNARMTPEKVRAYAESVDFGRLAGAERARAIQRLAEMLNALSLEERQRLRLDRTAYGWFEQMTEAERAAFLEATLPTGFKQMLGAFEKLPEDRRRRAVDVALRRLKESREDLAAGKMPMQGTNQPVVLSEELRQKMTTMGLNAFYTQSSAQTKADMAPVLEELQRMMQGDVIVIQSRRRGR
jgi:hypothetical protein